MQTIEGTSRTVYFPGQNFLFAVLKIVLFRKAVTVPAVSCGIPLIG